MAKIIPFKKSPASERLVDKQYGECPGCQCDEFHVLMDNDEEICGVECCHCRDEYLFEDTGISFELE